MSNPLINLQPAGIWNHFAELNSIPRASKKEQQVIEFMANFGKSLGLETKVDHIGNVIIHKASTPGMENRTPIVLQSHLDMVHQKNAGTNFDFATEGIKMFVDGDWVKADGTTLGADNGIGVATIMTILASNDIQHPAIDALFTIDEETGMTGALELQGGMLKGTILLNLDTEDDTELTIGCAGGIDVTAMGSYIERPTPKDVKSYKLSVSGLTGGHSGMDIHLGRGNANKIMNRLLIDIVEKSGAMLYSLEGGSLRNAIPRESFAEIAVPTNMVDIFEALIKSESEVILREYRSTDKDLTINFSEIDRQVVIVDQEKTISFLRSVYACPNGIYRMSPDIEHLVQSSNNLARIVVKGGSYTVMCLTRSSVDTEKMDLANAVRCAFELSGAAVEFSGSYPGWTPNPDAAIIKLMRKLYKDMHNSEPHVNACHAGLECGIIGRNYPKMEMISFGPNIRGAHSPDEKVQISSVQKFWDYLLEILKNVPE